MSQKSRNLRTAINFISQGSGPKSILPKALPFKISGKFIYNLLGNSADI